MVPMGTETVSMVASVGRIQQWCKCPSAGDTPHPTLPISPATFALCFLLRLTTEPSGTSYAEQPQSNGSCPAGEFCNVSTEQTLTNQESDGQPTLLSSASSRRTPTSAGVWML